MNHKSFDAWFLKLNLIEVTFFRVYLVTIRPYSCHSWAERREIWTHGTFPPWRAIHWQKKLWAVLLSNDIPTQWERSYSVVRYDIDVTFATMKSYVNCQEISWQKENICCFFSYFGFQNFNSTYKYFSNLTLTF